MFLDWFTIKLTRFGATPCINLYPTTACDAKNNNRKLKTLASYATKKYGIEYQGFLLRFCTHRNEFNCVLRSTKLRKYAIRSLIWSYAKIYVTWSVNVQLTMNTDIQLSDNYKKLRTCLTTQFGTDILRNGRIYRIY